MLDWLFGDTSPSNVKTTTKQQIPAWLETAGRDTVAEGRRLASQPYQAYGGPRIAALTPDQLAAMQKVRDHNGIGFNNSMATYNRAMGGGRPFDANELQQYINPYVTQVAQNTEREMARANDLLRIQTQAGAARAGAYGGSRYGVVDGMNNRDYTFALGDMYNKTYADAWDKGIGALFDQKRLEISSADSGLRSSVAGDNQFLADTNMRLGIGQLLQDQNQRNLDLAFSDWENQRKYPYEQIGFMHNLVQGVPYSQTTTATQPGQPTPGFFQQAAGLGIAAYGAFRQ